jgi:CBS-domain-containing membrane protein
MDTALGRLGLFLYRATGTAMAMLIMELLASYDGEPLWRVPFVTSIVLVTALPHSEASRPYAVIAGHMSSCAAGLVALTLLGPGNSSSAFAVGLSTFAMLALRAPHPPAGIDAFLIAGNALQMGWVISPVLTGCVLLIIFSQAWSMVERAAFGRESSRT